MEWYHKSRSEGWTLAGKKSCNGIFRKNKLKISLMNNAIGSDIQGQKRECRESLPDDSKGL